MATTKPTGKERKFMGGTPAVEEIPLPIRNSWPCEGVTMSRFI